MPTESSHKKAISRAIEYLQKRPENQGQDQDQELRRNIISKLLDLLPEEKDTPIAVNKIETLRSFLRKEMMKKEKNLNNEELCKQVFIILLMLAQEWPLNVDDEGEPTDSITREVIPSEKRVLTTRGEIFNKDSLTEYFSRNNAFQITQEGIVARDPVSHEPFSDRELAYFEDKGVVIPERNAALREGLELARGLGEGGMRVNHSRFRNTFFKGFFFGMGIGLYVGVFLGLVMLWIVSLFLPPVAWGSVIGVGLLCGAIEYYRSEPRELKSFWSGLNTGITGSIIVFVLGYFLGPLIIVGLATASIISPASIVAAITFCTTCVQPFIPAVVGGVLALKECFSPGTMKRVFDALAEAWVMIPAFLMMAAGATMGGFFGTLAVINRSLVSLCGGERAAEQPPRPMPRGPRALSQNARLHEVIRGPENLEQVVLQQQGAGVEEKIPEPEQPIIVPLTNQNNRREESSPSVLRRR